MQKFISIFIVVFLISCSMAPDYKRPVNVTAEIEKFKNTPEDNKIVEVSKWWTTLDDPLTDELVNKLINQSYNIEASYSRLKQAMQNSTIAGADLYPTLSANFDASRIKIPALPQTFSDGSAFKDFNLGLSTSWQLDFFGRNISNLKARTAEIEANIFEIDALIQSLIAQTVGQRITIAINAKRLTLAEGIVETREKTLQIVERRYKSGFNGVNALDVRLARENLAAAKAEIPNAEANLQESIYDLDLLLGQEIGKSEELDYESFTLIPPPQEIKIPLPASLLDRRPDLRASELRAIAANEQIGVAIADLYPNLTVSAGVNQTSRKSSDLIDSDLTGWSLLGNVTQKIFEAGRLRANVRLSEAQAEELVATYKNDILTAVKEVETALLREDKLLQQVALLTTNLEEAKHAERIASDRYSKGIGDIVEVLDTQRRLWQTGQNLLNAQEASWQNRIALYLAIGGDWEVNKENLNMDESDEERKEA